MRTEGERRLRRLEAAAARGEGSMLFLLRQALGVHGERFGKDATEATMAAADARLDRILMEGGRA